jgi:hypothetical protein
MRSQAASAAKGGRKIARQVWQNARRAATREKGNLHESFASQAFRNNPKMYENGCNLLMLPGDDELFVHNLLLFKASRSFINPRCEKFNPFYIR